MLKTICVRILGTIKLCTNKSALTYLKKKALPTNY